MTIWRKIKAWWNSWSFLCAIGLHECTECTDAFEDLNFYRDHVGDCTCKHCNKQMNPY